jgi:predicted RNA-binding Zn ribbon-like protein
MQIRHHAFRPSDLVGGHVVLDLVNTVTGRDTAPIDWLDGYPGALEWASVTGHFDEGVLAELARTDAREAGAGAIALDRVRQLREAAHDVLAATVRGDAVPTQALGELETHWKAAVARAHVSFAGGRARVMVGVEESRLDYLGDELSLRAVELLQSLPPERTRVCAGPRCGWLFIDRSRAGRRRWCDMAKCGNAAKSRRHYARKRALQVSD